MIVSIETSTPLSYALDVEKLGEGGENEKKGWIFENN